MSEPVNIFLRDTTPLQIPIEGVLVKVYDVAGALFFTQSTTDALGQVGFLLPPATYSLRFFKDKVGFSQPQQITVLPILPPPAVQNPANDFNVDGEVFVLPIATNPRLCRASGFFKDINGGPKKFLDLHFISKFDPILLEGNAVVTERVQIQTDENGFASIDLIRFGMYEVTVEAKEDTPRRITVPDSPSTNLPDLLLPVVNQVVLDPIGPYSLAVGAELIVTPTVLDSAGVELTGTAINDVLWKSSDTDVLVVTPSATTLTLRGIATGIADVEASRRDETIIRIPNTPVLGVPQTATVT